MSLIFYGRPVGVPGVSVRSWHDDPKLRLEHDRRARRKPWVRMVVVHTSWGKSPVNVRPGVGPNLRGDERMVEHWNSDPEFSGAHVAIDSDGSVVCCADLGDETTFHATSVNDISVGIEIKQTDRGDIWNCQLEVLVAVVDTITRELGIQRQLHYPYRGPIARLSSGGADCVGVFGHRDQTCRRGAGDPGDPAMVALIGSGYEPFRFHLGEDRDVWRGRQEQYGLRPDGIPGRMTVAALERAGVPRGLWVSRPGD